MGLNDLICYYLQLKKERTIFLPSSMPSSCIIHHLTKDTMMIHLLNSALQCTAIKKLKKKSKAYTKEKYGYLCLNGGTFKSIIMVLLWFFMLYSLHQIALIQKTSILGFFLVNITTNMSLGKNYLFDKFPVFPVWFTYSARHWSILDETKSTSIPFVILGSDLIDSHTFALLSSRIEQFP